MGRDPEASDDPEARQAQRRVKKAADTRTVWYETLRGLTLVQIEEKHPHISKSEAGRLKLQHIRDLDEESAAMAGKYKTILTARANDRILEASNLFGSTADEDLRVKCLGTMQKEDLGLRQMHGVDATKELLIVQAVKARSDDMFAETLREFRPWTIKRREAGDALPHAEDEVAAFSAYLAEKAKN